MKVRNGFVSNSSSSSFIMLIPKSFNIDEMDLSAHESNLSDTTEDDFRKAVKKLQNDKGMWQGEDYKHFYIITQILSDFVIGQVEGGPDDGSISVLSDKEVEKVKKLIEA